MYRTRFLEDCPGDEFVPAINPPVKRLIAIGDVHGDYEALIQILQFCDLITVSNSNKETLTTANIQWTGGTTWVVQIGDQVDGCRPAKGKKCPETSDPHTDVQILLLCNTLQEQAREAGGEFISLLGNHEILNVDGYMQYVAPQDIAAFDNYRNIPNGLTARRHAFKPGNEFARMLGCRRMAIVIIGSHLFVHAGMLDSMIDPLELRTESRLEQINMLIRQWLINGVKTQAVDTLIGYGQDTIFWNRVLGLMPTGLTLEECEPHISELLELFHLNGIIIGHTPQPFTTQSPINSTCDKKVWRIDVAFSKAFNDMHQKPRLKRNRRPQALEIINDREYFLVDANGRHAL